MFEHDDQHDESEEESVYESAEEDNVPMNNPAEDSVEDKRRSLMVRRLDSGLDGNMWESTGAHIA